MGNLEDSSKYIRQVLELVSDGPVFAGVEHSYAAATIPLFARVTGRTELLDVAESAAREALSSPSIPNLDILTARVGLALIAIQRGDEEAAKEQYAVLESRRGTQLYAVICYDRLLGLLAQTIGDLDDAQGHFEEALEFCRKAGYRTELAWSLFDYAASRQAQGQREGALALLDEALSVSTEIGMSPLNKRVAALKEEIERRGVHLKSLTYPSGLTAREVQVLLLIAQGKTTREIANQLVISPRTVQRHTTNLYAKINARNRVEATAFALNELTTST